MKAYLRNPSKSDEDFLNELIRPYIDAARIKGPGGIEFHLDKGRTSKLLGQKIEVPEKLRKSLERYGLEEAVAQNFAPFVEDCLEESHLIDMTQNVLALLGDSDSMERACLVKAAGDPSVFLARSLLIAIRNPNTAIDGGELWHRGTGRLSWKSGDLFKFGFGNRHSRPNIVVIPVNTGFDVHVTRKQEGSVAHLVSDRTLHGQWTARLLASGISESNLTERIQADLAVRGLTKNVSGRYPVGTIAVIEHGCAIYYLLATADFDRNNNARSSKNGIRLALTSLADFYDRNGQGTDIYLPLVGTGMSRAGLSSKESFDLVRDVFTSPATFLAGKATIVVTPEAARELDLEER